MFGSRNRVTAGDYQGFRVKANRNGVSFIPPLFGSGGPPITLSNSTVSRYDVVSSDQRKSAASTIIRGLIGKYFLGLVGLIGGTVSAKNSVMYTVSIEFVTGERSLMEIDDKVYKFLIRATY